MTVASVRLQNFRSYPDQSFEFEPGVNIIVGPNASGKTNLLEAIFVVARGFSYKTSHLDELVSHTRAWSRLDCLTDQSQTRTIKLQLEKGPEKGIVIDDKPYKKMPPNEIISTVLFEPSQLYLITTSPEMRRNYIDDILEQTDQQFGATRRQYQRALKQRNSLLKQPFQKAMREVFAWNVRLSDLAGQYVQSRLRLIDAINESIPEVYNHIAKSNHNLHINYSTELKGSDYATTMLRTLERNFELDHQRGFTTAGPHRDDIQILIDKNDIRTVASRGEIRTTLLTLKIKEALLIEFKTDKKPLFLLDDVFGELDGARRHALTEFLKDYQTFITTTDADIVNKEFTQKTNLLSVTT